MIPTVLRSVLRLVANVFFPAVAGYIVTLHLVWPFGLASFPSLHPEAMVMIPLTGLVTLMLCMAALSARRVVARRIAA